MNTNTRFFQFTLNFFFFLKIVHKHLRKETECDTYTRNLLIRDKKIARFDLWTRPKQSRKCIFQK